MAEEQVVVAARAELYALSPDEFLTRRGELVAALRATAPAAARAIGALRKPTRAAFAVNRLVRAHPDAPDRLAELGARLRAAQAALDGPLIRDLSEERNRLIAELTGAALAAAGVANAAIGVRDDVIATLTAALADPAVLDDLRAGALVRPARWDGFADVGPALTLVRDRPQPASGRPVPPAAQPAAQPPVRPADERRAERRAELKRDADAAATALRDAQAELGDARRRADDAALAVRVAERRLAAARAALDRASR